MEEINTYLQEITALRHKIHRRPSLSGEESETAEIICSFLADCKPDKLENNIGGYGVVATFKGGENGPKILLRCELDALPITEKSGVEYSSLKEGKAHSCGHDGHMAVLCAIARAISLNRSLLGEGEITLLFQPEEEIGRGAKRMAEELTQRGVHFDYAIAFHNWPGKKYKSVILYPECYAWASTGMKIEFKGKPSHASDPQLAINPTLTIMRFIERVLSLNEKLSYSTIVNVNIGSEDYGITPGEGYVALTLRSNSDKGLQSLVYQIEKEARSLAAENALGINISYTDHFPATVNSKELTQMIEEVAKEEGYNTERDYEGTHGSDDFVYFTKISTQSSFFDVGAGENHPQLHDPAFDFDDSLIPVFVKIICSVCRRILQTQ
ncbi:MAG: amidohydrolase [Bacteroidales bacterium]|nr:amidohydrolase [Bacteroidales bacterium]